MTFDRETLIAAIEIARLLKGESGPTTPPPLRGVTSVAAVSETPPPQQPERAVLVTTDKRGVFFGYATDVTSSKRSPSTRRGETKPTWRSCVSTRAAHAPRPARATPTTTLPRGTAAAWA